MPESPPPPPPATRGGTRRLFGAAIGLAAGVLALLVRSTPVGERLEYPFVDVRTRQHAGDRAPDPRIVLAQIVEEDVAEVKRTYGYSWPWPLDVNAGMVRVLTAANAKALVVDIYHFDRGQGLDDFVGKVPQSPALQAEIEGEAAAAEDYGNALKEFARAVLAYELTNHPSYDVPARRAAAEALLFRQHQKGSRRRAIERTGANFPVRRVTNGAADLGYANVEKDLDGVVRRASVEGRLTGARVTALAAAALPYAMLPDGWSGHKPVFPSTIVPDTARTREVPVNDDGTFLVDYRGPARHTYQRVRPAQLVDWSKTLTETKTLPPEAKAALEDKIVVFGFNLAGLADIHPTSIHENYDGPEFQATALDDLLNGGGRVYAPRIADAALILLAAILAGGLGWAARKKWVAPLGALAVAAGAVAFSWIAFGRGVCFDVASPVAGVVLAWGGTLTARSLTEGRYNRWLEATFSRYLAPSVIEALKRNPALLQLGGETRELTILFSDVQGFTSLSKRLGAPQIVRLLNAYLTSHCDAVFENGGVVDKFIGDAVMAFYGDPVPQGDHALRACRTALGVLDRLPALKPLLTELGVDEFPVRIGLNSGTAVVGNMGSAQRFDYTCMGDTVNRASRLEGANKAFGSRILAGEATVAAAGDAVLSRLLARVGVVGDPEPLGVYEVLALKATASPDLVAHVAAFQRAQEAARAGDLDAAERSLAEAERLRPGDGATVWFRGLVQRMRAGSEPLPWSGVVVLKEK